MAVAVAAAATAVATAGAATAAERQRQDARAGAHFRYAGGASAVLRGAGLQLTKRRDEHQGRRSSADEATPGGSTAPAPPAADVWGLGRCSMRLRPASDHSTFPTALARPCRTARPSRVTVFSWLDPRPKSALDDGCPLTWRRSSTRACTEILTSGPLWTVSPQHSQCSRPRPQRHPTAAHPETETVTPHLKPPLTHQCGDRRHGR